MTYRNLVAVDITGDSNVVVMHGEFPQAVSELGIQEEHSRVVICGFEVHLDEIPEEGVFYGDYEMRCYVR